MNLAAHTAVGGLPAYLSINTVEDTVQVIVRGNNIDGVAPSAAITISLVEFRILVRSMAARLETLP